MYRVSRRNVNSECASTDLSQLSQMCYICHRYVLHMDVSLVSHGYVTHLDVSRVSDTVGCVRSVSRVSPGSRDLS